MRIGVFGGAFNPPHLGHLIVAETLREQGRLDQVWWIPSHVSPQKQGQVLPVPEHRLEMTRLATADNPAFVVSDCEIRRGGVSYTVETLRDLQHTHPEHTFVLCIGGDSLRDLGTWRAPEEIVARVSLLVYQRPDATLPADPRFAHRVQLVEAPLLPLSSTDLRQRIATGRSIRYLVPEPVRAYIVAHDLYRDMP
jgi:nicotinate-nucleotide adenylyltransferase